jgi:hypothetical protein
MSEDALNQMWMQVLSLLEQVISNDSVCSKEL